MIEIKVCPSTLADGFSSYSQVAINNLFDGKDVSHIIDFSFNSSHISENLSNAIQRISVSGVQEKFPALIDNGYIRFSEKKERSTHILKPAPWNNILSDRKYIPANEHLTMQIASQVYRIQTAANGLCFTKKGELVYITKRFDILPDDSKVSLEDFASLIGRNEATNGTRFKYDSSYEDIAICIHQYIPAWQINMKRFFMLVIFNYIYANGDAHLKNFSVMNYNGKYQLAPAYDLLNTSLHISDSDFALENGLSIHLKKTDTYQHTNHPCREDFFRFGILIGLSDKCTNKILDKFMQMPELTQKLIANSFLPNKLKRKYLKIVQERISRFIRKAE